MGFASPTIPVITETAATICHLFTGTLQVLGKFLLHSCQAEIAAIETLIYLTI
jgi:hypothetical protein